MSQGEILPAFEALGLPHSILQSIQSVGYETPSPIQEACIPVIMEGRDIVGQAQTGTGKTAAFALPLLSKIDLSSKDVQVLVLAPTRELAIQVSEACQTYARNMKGFHVLPIYGGQSYTVQLKQLRRGVQFVVGTPGRIMDHMRKGTLKLDNLQALVLDEADEMLRMGFIDDVKWVLEHIPDACQIALFSATMPREIQKVAREHLSEPEEIKIKSETSTATTINQRWLSVNNNQKLDAITRVLEVEDFDGVIVFVRTKNATVELSDKLSARGYAAEALNGDMPQANREKIVKKLKSSKLDILVATDVVARGLDVERISHVINYDIPYDTESYVHRIGRTGRAGREGSAILFVTSREKRMLSAIEKATNKRIDRMHLPGVEEINQARISRFKTTIQETIDQQDLSLYANVLEQFMADFEGEPEQVMAALAYLAQNGRPLMLEAVKEERREKKPRERNTERHSERGERKRVTERDLQAQPLKDHPDVAMKRYQLEVGSADGVKPGNIVGAIANEADIDSCYIGQIEIFEAFTYIDLPEGMPSEVFHALKKVRVCQKPLNIAVLKAGGSARKAADEGESADKSKKVKKKPKKKTKESNAAAKKKAAGKLKKERKKAKGKQKVGE